jgi:hypothetical protein
MNPTYSGKFLKNINLFPPFRKPFKTTLIIEEKELKNLIRKNFIEILFYLSNPWLNKLVSLIKVSLIFSRVNVLFITGN